MNCTLKLLLNREGFCLGVWGGWEVESLKASENNEAIEAQLSELPFEMVGVACCIFQRAGLSCLSAWDDES